jgi:hypothetical protein
MIGNNDMFEPMLLACPIFVPAWRACGTIGRRNCHTTQAATPGVLERIKTTLNIAASTRGGSNFSSNPNRRAGGISSVASELRRSPLGRLNVVPGTSRHFAALHNLVTIRGITDVGKPHQSVAKTNLAHACRSTPAADRGIFPLRAGLRCAFPGLRLATACRRSRGFCPDEATGS